MKVLVTGGSGFIGTNLSLFLTEEGHEVRVLDLRSPNFKAEYVKGDIRDYETVKRAVEGIEAVVHLAAMVSAVEATEKPEEATEINVMGTLNLLEASRRQGVRRFVYASSVAVYGEPLYLPVDERHPNFPVNVYGATKLGGEALVNGYSGNYGLSTVSLRFFNVYGPWMRPGPYSGVILKFLEFAHGNEPFRIEGDGRQTRDFIYVEDVVRAIQLALEEEFTGAYNVGTGKETSIIELARLVSEVVGIPCRVEHAPPRKGDIRRSVADPSKLMLRGWRPKVDLKEGLRRTNEWYERFVRAHH